MIYLGHDSYCDPFDTDLQTEAGEPIFGLKIGSSCKATKLYVVGEENMSNWKNAFLKAMGRI